MNVKINELLYLHVDGGSDLYSITFDVYLLMIFRAGHLFLTEVWSVGEVNLVHFIDRTDLHESLPREILYKILISPYRWQHRGFN